MKDIPNWEEKYSITEDEKVFNKHSNCYVSTYTNSLGYQMLTLIREKTGERLKTSIHRLLALTFLPNPDNLPTVDHIDRNPANNNLSNLRWASWETQFENRDHEAHIAQCHKMQGQGTNAIKHPIIMCDKYTHEPIKKFDSSCAAAVQMFNDWGKNSRINRCAQGKCKSAYGYWWKFKNKT